MLRQTILSQTIKFGDLATKSTFVFDLREFLLAAPAQLVQEAGTLIWNGIKDLDVQVIYGVGSGSMILLHAVRYAAAADGRHLIALFCRDERKNHGLRKMVEGPVPADVPDGAGAIFIDDALNSGGTQRRSLTTLEREGFNVRHLGIGCLVDFWHHSRKERFQGRRVHAVFTRHDLGLTRIDATAPLVEHTPVWHRLGLHKFDVMPAKAPPVILHDKLYCPSDDTSVWCLDPLTGEAIWRVESDKPQPKGSCTQMIADEQHVYWTAYDGVLRKAVHDTGEIVWAAKLDHALHSTPCFNTDKTVLFVGTEYDKHAINRHWNGHGDIVAVDAATGKVLWRTRTKGMIPASPAYIAERNLVVCGSNDYHMYVLDAQTGGIVYRLNTKGEVKFRPSVKGNKLLCVSCTGWAQTFDLDTGKQVWERRIGHNSLHAQPYVHEDIAIYVNDTHMLIALEIETGQVRWCSRLRGKIGWGVTKLNEQEILAVCHNGLMTSLNVNTGVKTRLHKLEWLDHMKNPGLYQPPVIYKGLLILSTNYKGVVAFKLMEGAQ